MADGLLGLLGGGGNTGGMDLNQLVRPPDPLGDALAAMSERFAQAGQASRLPTSTLGALGSALGGASTAARASQTQYLDQAIKLEALKRSLRQAGIDERLAPILFKQLQGAGAGPTPAATPMPGAPRAYASAAMPAAAPAAPSANLARPQAVTPGDFGASGDVPPMGNYANPPDASTLPPLVPGAPPGFAPSNLPPGSPGTVTFGNPPVTYAPSGGGKITNTGLLGRDTVIPNQGGAGAATTLASFRPADLVAPDGRAGNGAGDAGSGLDLRGLLALDRGGGAADPFAGLLATDAPIQPGGPDTLVKSGDQSQLPVERASLAVPSKDDPRGMIPFIRERAQAYGVNPDTAVAVARSEGLGSFYGDGGKSGTAFQLYTGGGLGNEFQKQTGLDPLDPKNEQAAIDWALANVHHTGWSPYHGAKTVGVSDRTGLPDGGDGGGGRPNVQLAQYAPGGVPPLVGPGSGTIPGLNMTPQQVAAFNALYGLAGHTGSPLKEFLDIYYKSPEYLRQSEQEKAQGQRAVTEPSDIRIAQQKAVEDRVTKQMEQLGSARLSLAPNGILVPDGQGGQTRVQATVEQAVRAANGLPVPELGIKGMYPDTKGGAAGAAGGTPGDTTRPAGPLAGEPVPTPQQKELQTYGTEVFKKEHGNALTAKTAIENTNELLKLMDDGVISGAGADTRTRLLRLGQLAGVTGKSEDELIANTEAFISEAGRNLTTVLKGLGPPVSNIDVKVAERIVGSNDQSIGGLKKILEIVDRNSRRAITDFNKKASMMPQTKEIPSFVVPEPFRHGSTIIRNDKGEQFWNNNGTWVPMQ